MNHPLYMPPSKFYLLTKFFLNHVLIYLNALLLLLNQKSYIIELLINQAGGLYGRILTEVVSTDRMQ